MNIKLIAQTLKNEGIKIGKITMPDQMVDGAIDLPQLKGFHLQIGYGYICLCQMHKDSLEYHGEYFDCVTAVEKVIYQIKTLLK
jgi:hypothetical protein